MDQSMTNEECKKLVNYYYQLATFALTMQDDMKNINCPEWEKIATDLLNISQDMNKFITTTMVSKICN
jgi:hypothetical protein